MKTKLLSILLLLCMLVPAAPVSYAVDGSAMLYENETVAQYDNAIEEIPEPSELPYGPPDQGLAYLSPSEDWEFESGILFAIEQELITAIKNGESSLDISKFKLRNDLINLNVLMYYSPYISGGISIECWYYSDSYYARIDITCPLSKSEVSTRFAEIDARIDEICDLLSEYTTDLEKALFLHDYLIYTGEYDYDNLLSGTIPPDSFRSAGILINRVGVCQSYAYAYKYILHRQGIECHVVTSNAMNHAWNIIKLDSAYYHVDLTWDDPARDDLGQVLHSHFLLSDSAVSSARGDPHDYHYAWDSNGIECSSTMYDNAYWVKAISNIYTVGNSIYYIRDNGIVRRDAQSGKERFIKTFDKWLTADGKGYWFKSFSGLWLNGSKLYYNSPRELRCIDIYTLVDKAVYNPSTQDVQIFGSAAFGDTMYYQLKSDHDEKGVIHTVPLYILTEEETVELDCEYITLEVGESVKLEAVIKNGDADSALFWKSDEALIASVSTEGVVTASSAGITYITVSTENGACDSCLVTVTSNDIIDEPSDPEIKTDSSAIFTDVKNNSWFKSAVDYVVDKRLMNGTSETLFEPNSPMNRAMLVTVLWRMEGSPEPEASTPFTDLKQSWYRDAVAWAYSNNIVNGTAETTFSPTKSITREQMAAILFRYSEYKNYLTLMRSDVSLFPDGNKISAYALEAMAWANGMGIISGKPVGDVLYLEPRGNATRAEVATILQRYLSKY